VGGLTVLGADRDTRAIASIAVLAGHDLPPNEAPYSEADPTARSVECLRARAIKNEMAACHADEVGSLGPDRTVRSAVEEAAALGVAALAELVAGAREGITIVDAGRRFVYANPAACGVLGPLEQLRGQDFIERVPEREFVLGRFAEQIAGESASFSGTLIGTDGAERELVWSNTTIEIAGRPHGVAIFRDLTGPRGATRSAVALAQAAAQFAGAGSSADVLASIARHAVEGSRRSL
jgi:PAS domain S-box-containing protein